MEVPISLKREVTSRHSSAADIAIHKKRDSYVPGKKPSFKIWKRSFTPQVLALLEGKDEDNSKSSVWASEIFNSNLFPLKMSISQLRSAYMSNKQTQILATLVPNEIIYTKHPMREELQTFVGVLLFADVSGFTALCEKYNNTGKGGTYRLTATLNGYIGAMVEVIYSHGGDVLKFSGDAFLALWKVRRDDVMAYTIHRVIHCATYIQHTLGSFETDVKVFLKVKLAISAGSLYFSVVGNNHGRHYVCVGTPVEDVKAAEHTCVSGDIVLSPSAWGHCSPLNYEHSFKDQYHVKVTQILYDPSAKKRQVLRQSNVPPITVNTDLHGPRDHAHETDEDTDKELDYGKTMQEPTKEGPWLPTKIDFKRKQLREAAQREMGDALRQFLIPPVVQQVDADQPLEYLTEMRQVTIMFVNIIPVKMTPVQLVAMSGTAYALINTLVRSSLGCVNKMCLFDKDCMLLVIFGLRGFKTELETQNALKCAYRVCRQVSEIEGVDTVSAGVTTGMTYCGVVGHPLRKEYTVIGGVVNKAARIMCAYPGKVTTEQVTYQLSKLPPSNFILQEAKELKGLGMVNFIYEYTEDKSHLEDVNAAALNRLPLLGRDREMSEFTELLVETNFPGHKKRGLLIVGEARIGKSRLLEEMVIEAKRLSYRPLFASLDSFHSTTANSLAYALLKQVLGLGDTCSVRDREETLVSVLGKFVTAERLCYLNDLLQVKYPHSMAYITDDDDDRRQIAHTLIKRIMELSEAKMLIFIDDIHFSDPSSGQLLLYLLEQDVTTLVMTVLQGERPTPLTVELKTHDNIKLIELGGLGARHLAPLACQVLDVRAIPVELDSDDDVTKSLVVPDKRLVSTSAVQKPTKVPEEGEEGEEEEEEETVPVCVVPSDRSLTALVLPENLDAIIMTAFDSLPPYEQLLLKIGSVLGQTFTRKMLVAVMHNPTASQTAVAVSRVFDMHILCCATSVTGSFARQHSYVSHLSVAHSFVGRGVVACYCEARAPDFSGGAELPPYAFCQLMRFKIPAFRDTTYELLPGNQKKNFHARAAAFLESQAHKCSACGGGGFVTVPSVLIQEIESQESLLSDTPLGGSVTSASQEESKRGSLVSEGGSKRESTETERGSKTKSVEADESVEPGKSNLTLHQILGHTMIGRNRVAPTPVSSKNEAKRNEAVDLVTACLGLQRAPQKSRAIQKYSTFSMGKPVTQVDFRDCECPLILAGVYQQLIEHCAVAELKEKQIRFMIEYGAANIIMGNNMQAINILTSAVELCTAYSNAGEIDRSTSKLDLGKIHTLLGQAHLDLCQLPEARINLLIAMRYFGRPFYSTPIMSGLLIQFNKYQQKLHQTFPNTYIGRSQGKKAVVNDEVSACLAHLNNMFMMEKDWQLARLAALKGLNLAQKSPNNMVEICTAYSNLMDVCHHFGELEYCRQLEVVALRHKYSVSEAKDLLALGRLYCALFSSRGLRGELDSAITIGFRVMQISTRVNASNVKLFVLPLLIQAMGMTGRCSEGVDLFAQLDSQAREDWDLSTLAWYYALSLDMILDAGYTLEKSSDCLAFARRMLSGRSEGSVIVRDQDSERRMIVSSWLWFTRTQEWAEASKWEKLAMRYTGDKLEYTFSNIVTMMKLLEGMLIHLSVKLGKSRPRNLEPWRKETYTFLKRLEKVALAMKIVQPRFYHMKAYYCQIYQHKTKASHLIRKARDLSCIQGNRLEEAWTTHSEAHWFGRLNTIDRYYWKEHNTIHSGVDWHQYELYSWSSVMYTFETPFNDKLK